MNICATIQSFCKTISPFHHNPITYSEPKTASQNQKYSNREGKSHGNDEEKISRKEEQVNRRTNDEADGISNEKEKMRSKGGKENASENPNLKIRATEENPKLSKESSSTSDDFPSFTIRRNNVKNTNVMYSYNMQRRSSSASHREASKRKRRNNSTFSTHTIYSPLKTSKSFDSKIKTKISQSSSVVRKRASSDGEPVKILWPNKDAAVYSAFTADPPERKPKKYCVHTELKYIVLLPTDKPKRKLRFEPPPAPTSPTPSAPPSPTPSTHSKTRQWNPHALEGKEFGPQDKESFASVYSSDSDESFVPRSQARSGSQPRGRFCCVKRQVSG